MRQDAWLSNTLSTTIVETIPADWNVVKKAVDQALDALDAMRAREAAHLVKDLLAILRRMRGTLARRDDPR